MERYARYGGRWNYVCYGCGRLLPVGRDIRGAGWKLASEGKARYLFCPPCYRKFIESKMEGGGDEEEQ